MRLFERSNMKSQARSRVVHQKVRCSITSSTNIKFVITQKQTDIRSIHFGAQGICYIMLCAALFEVGDDPSQFFELYMAQISLKDGHALAFALSSYGIHGVPIGKGRLVSISSFVYEHDPLDDLDAASSRLGRFRFADFDRLRCLIGDAHLDKSLAIGIVAFL